MLPPILADFSDAYPQYRRRDPDGHAPVQSRPARGRRRLSHRSVQRCRCRPVSALQAPIRRLHRRGFAYTDTLARFYGAIIQGMSAQACDGACNALLKRMIDLSLAAWPGKRGI